jgi:DNA processing protein
MVAPNVAQTAAMVALLRERPGGRGWRELTEMVAEAGDAATVWEQLGPAPALFEATESSDPVATAERDVRRWQAEGPTVLTLLDRDYPPQLREVHEMPPVLFARGTLVARDHGVCVVGSRSASPTALDFAGEVSTRLVEQRWTVVSGLALGVDTAAHTAALNAGGRTVALIATGIHKTYPPQNAELQERIANDGLLLSQFWPDAPPQKRSFLMRNAVMSGYGRATIVVAAGEHSGARAQARMAVEHGRPVILTNEVMRATEWAKALEGRPGVHTVRTVDQALDVVSRVAKPLAEELPRLLAGAR